MKPPQPGFALDAVKDLCEKRAVSFRRTSAMDHLIAERGTYLAGVAFAVEVIQSLTEDDFVEPAHLSRDDTDVYGKVVDGKGWYIKLTIEDGFTEKLLVISFHPPRFPLRTRGG